MTKTKMRNVLAAVLFSALLTLAIPSTVMAEQQHNDKTNSQHRDKAKSHGADKEGNKVVSVEMLGWLQLQAHDLFFVERGDRINANTATDFENGELDLSTLFVDTTDGSSPFDIDTIKIGGEIRNRENIMLFSVASHLGEKYADFIEDGDSPDDAKAKTIKKYHKMLKKTYEKTFDEKFPEKRDGDVTFTENLAFRTVHDFLPGEILLDGISTPVLSIPPLTPLTKDELKQLSSPLDGTFDCEFRHIEISHPGGPTIIVDLLEADSSFADQFDTKFSFEFFLEELEDGSYDKKDKVMKQIRKLIGKGLKF